MFSEDEEDRTVDTGSNEGHDKKMEEQWSRRKRRRSSALKRFFEDKLKLQDNPRIGVILTKNGE